MSLSLGIDLGTTNSCVAVFKNDRVEVIPDQIGAKIIPSVVFFDGKHVLVGKAAEYKFARGLPNIIYEAKRLIGRRFSEVRDSGLLENLFFPVEKGQRDQAAIRLHKPMGSRGRELVTPQEISAHVLEKLKASAQDYLGLDEIEAVTVTVPAHFGDLQRKRTLEAGKMAGFRQVKIINEPTAAAVAYGFFSLKQRAKQRVLVYDLGGGTFDVSVMDILGHNYDVRHTDGDVHLGGNDFDYLMVEACVREYQKGEASPAPRGELPLRRLKLQCESAKKVLSDKPEAAIRIPNFGRPGHRFQKRFTRKEFEALIEPELDRANQIVVDLLQRNGIGLAEVSKVLLVGGSTNIPLVKQKLAALFKKTSLRHQINPDESVAIGASIYAGVEAAHKPKVLKELRIHDVTPLSIGTDTEGGRFSVIIPQSTPIPYQKTKTYYTARDAQTQMSLNIYEGQDEFYKNNKRIQKYRLKALPPRPKGEVEVEVTLALDKNSSLTMTAHRVDSGERHVVTVKHSGQPMTDQAIQDFRQSCAPQTLEEANQRAQVQDAADLDCLLAEIEAILQDKDAARFIAKRERAAMQKEFLEAADWRAKNAHATSRQLGKAIKRLRREWDQFWANLKRRFDAARGIPSTPCTFEDLED